MKRTLFVLSFAAAAAIPVAAHHSFAAHYFEEQIISVEGVIVEFEYTAPHAWVHLDASQPGSGETQRFSAEWANPNRLSREGITKDSLKPGDRVTIMGSPGRVAGENKLHLKGIERASDGWRWGRR